MKLNCAYKWMKKEESRKRVLLLMKLPLTAKQINSKLRIDSTSCSRILKDFTARGLTICLNPTARNSRLYHLTDLGRQCQNQLRQELNLQAKDIQLPDIDWNLYGWLCFSHRSAIVKIITEPMQPSKMKRQIRRKNSDVKISANNIRDVMRLFEKKGVVEKVYIKKKAHPRYKLTKTGKQLQELLLKEKACY